VLGIEVGEVGAARARERQQFGRELARHQLREFREAGVRHGPYLPVGTFTYIEATLDFTGSIGVNQEAAVVLTAGILPTARSIPIEATDRGVISTSPEALTVVLRRLIHESP
jgi:hypothetical protein